MSCSQKIAIAAVLLLCRPASAQIPAPTDAPKPLTPQESAAAFRLPDGFRMEVIANEPLIASPSGMCWDERGRMFVSELHGYNLEGQLDIEELNKTGQLDTQVRRVQAAEKFKKEAASGTFGVVKMLRDTDSDGRMDQADVWAHDLPPAYGLVAARGGVVVACAPDIIFLADRDGDGVAEVRERLYTGFPAGVLERGINAPQWGPDGWIYFGRGLGGGTITGPRLPAPVPLPDSDFRIRADGTALEPLTGGTHTFGFAITESGDRFVVTTTSPAIHVAPLPWRYLIRNPDAAATGIESETGDRRAYSISPPHPWRKRRADDPEYFKYYNSRYGAAESEADGWFSAACGPMIYHDHALPGLHGHYFVCEPSGNFIHRALIHTDGAPLKIGRAPGEEKSEFAASRDPWSHPISLTHGPDGAIWVVDYYREIIEDYSAIPRHLQQQYGLSNGARCGRLYRLTHRDMAPMPAADIGGLDAAALARETASPLLWRRQTAQRLLTERGEKGAVSVLRSVLTGTVAEPSAIITALHTLAALGALMPEDAQPFLTHANDAVRVHALQLADGFFSKNEALLDAAIQAAALEQNPRVLLQFALSLGETRSPRAFAMLARFARERLDIPWMDAALLSSLHSRGGEMLATLLLEPGKSLPLLLPLAHSIAAHGDAAELALALTHTAAAPPELKPQLQTALAPTRKTGLPDPSSGSATTTESPAAKMDVSDETFRKFLAALADPRDAKRGSEIFTQSCAICHKIGHEGHVFGPDLLGELGVAEETLVRHILLPNERIRPGYETTLVALKDNTTSAGLLKNDGATSLTLLSPGGIEQIILKKDVATKRRLATSLMPSFAEAITPADLANLLSWLRHQPHAPK
jgi:putative membrane-bound dehydrogenase-like protein